MTVGPKENPQIFWSIISWSLYSNLAAPILLNFSQLKCPKEKNINMASEKFDSFRFFLTSISTAKYT